MDPPFRFFVSISYLLGSVNAGGDADYCDQLAHRLAMTGLQEQRCRPGSGRPGGRPLRASTVKCSVGAAAHIGPAAPALKISVGRDAHIAPHGRRRGLPPSRQGSTSAERVADGDAETMRKQGAKFAHPDTRGREDRCRRHLSRGKDFKTLVLTAFFPPFLRRKKGGRRRHSAGDADCRTGAAGHRFAMTGFGKYRLIIPAEFSTFS